ncbi:patatin-like phospholipase family protein [Hydrogenovibrio sp. 3SP14C1]|uniref:patatin-like phospholipase family protein n=1 Tax=Hydrogenovibrio sp. 3SP14C1 TaxID=3038774 RepID=UPI002416949F|nr:patatin-like phospholipase family protein [Hydrogenovibrio sp. 3SP14C1]MDG4813507.1 patatin-like phospholipase family protein [Hydrogenovibrio sp. 3SP14C1]
MANANSFSIKWVIYLFIIISNSANANQPPSDSSRPKIGLVLPGGGAHGLAHIGVLKQLERLNIPIDYISGSSMGAVIGGLYATGLSASQIESFVIHVNWDQTFTDSSTRHFFSFRQKSKQLNYFAQGELGYGNGRFKLPNGLIQGQQQATILKGMTLASSTIKDFDKLPIPFRAVATDVKTGEEVVLKSGNLSQALRASMAVPGIFAPVLIDGRYLVDGGVTNNTPINVVREMGADIVIVSDIHTPNDPKMEMDSYVNIGGQILSGMINANSLRQLKTLKSKDILIRPTIPNSISPTSFNDAKEIIQTGSQACLDQQAPLKNLSHSSYTSATPPKTLPIIDAIEFHNETHISNDVIRHMVHQEVGTPIDRTQLETDITRLYGLGFFELVTYNIEKIDQKNVLIIHTAPPSWGPHFFKLKFNLASNLDDSNLFNIGVRHTYIPANNLGGEWQNEIGVGQTQLLKTSFYQPLSFSQKTYIEPSFQLKKQNYTLGTESNLSAVQLEQQTMTPKLELGYNLSPTWRAAISYENELGDIILGRYTSSQIKEHYNDHIFSFRVQHDNLDQVTFPRRGTLLNMSYHNTFDRLDQQASKVIEYKGLLSSYFSYQRHTFNVHLEATDIEAKNSDDIHRFYTLGGFQRLSGYSEDELIGNQLLFAKVKYLYRLSASTNPLDFPYYLGATLEAGNLYDKYNLTTGTSSDISWDNTKQAGSIFIGMNTVMGPLYFAYGYHNSQRQSLYLYFGHALN